MPGPAARRRRARRCCTARSSRCPSRSPARTASPVNALLGTANLILQAVERHDPRAVVLCFGAEAAHYRVEAYPAYHADRPEMPAELVPQWQDAPATSRVRLDHAWSTPSSRPTTCSARSPRVETDAGGTALLFTGDRDMFQCVGDSVAVLFPGRQGRARADRRRRGAQALRDRSRAGARLHRAARRPVGRAARAPRASARRPPATCCRCTDRSRGRSPTRCASARGSRAALRDGADELRVFRDIATLRHVDVERPPDRPTDFATAAAAAAARGMNRLAERLQRLADAPETQNALTHGEV